MVALAVWIVRPLIRALILLGLRSCLRGAGERR